MQRVIFHAKTRFQIEAIKTNIKTTNTYSGIAIRKWRDKRAKIENDRQRQRESEQE